MIIEHMNKYSYVRDIRSLNSKKSKECVRSSNYEENVQD